MRAASRHVPLVLACALFAVSASPQEALAQAACQPPDGLSTCIASDNLWTHPGGGRWFSLMPTATAEAGSLSLGVTPTYYHRPIGLTVSSADPDGTTIYAVENVVATTFTMGLGLTDQLQLNMAAPAIMYQRGASKADVVGSEVALPRAAMGDLRFGVTYAILPRVFERDGLGLAARFEIAAPSGNDQAFSGFGSATYAPGAALDHRIGDLSLGLDVGARLRRASTLATTTIGHQLALAAGAGYDVLEDGWLSVNLESWALVGLAGAQRRLVRDGATVTTEDGPLHIPIEWLLSVRTAGLVDGRLRASLGGGSFIPTSSELAATTPAFRFVLGLHYATDAFYATDEDDD